MTNLQSANSYASNRVSLLSWMGTAFLYICTCYVQFSSDLTRFKILKYKWRGGGGDLIQSGNKGNKGKDVLASRFF